jgi:hypothetical protein
VVDTNGIEMYLMTGGVSIHEADSTLWGYITGWTSTTSTLTFEICDQAAVANAAWTGAVATSSNAIVRTNAAWPLAIVDTDADPDIGLGFVETAGTVASGTVKVAFTAGVPTYTFCTGEVTNANILEFPVTSHNKAVADSNNQTVSVWMLLSTDALS